MSYGLSIRLRQASTHRILVQLRFWQIFMHQNKHLSTHPVSAEPCPSAARLKSFHIQDMRPPGAHWYLPETDSKRGRGGGMGGRERARESMRGSRRKRKRKRRRRSRQGGRMHACMHACVCVCVCACVYDTHARTHLHTHTYAHTHTHAYILTHLSLGRRRRCHIDRFGRQVSQHETEGSYFDCRLHHIPHVADLALCHARTHTHTHTHAHAHTHIQTHKLIAGSTASLTSIDPVREGGRKGGREGRVVLKKRGRN
jgi:hypothetical protein